MLDTTLFKCAAFLGLLAVASLGCGNFMDDGSESPPAGDEPSGHELPDYEVEKVSPTTFETQKIGDDEHDSPVHLDPVDLGGAPAAAELDGSLYLFSVNSDGRVSVRSREGGWTHEIDAGPAEVQRISVASTDYKLGIAWEAAGSIWYTEMRSDRSFTRAVDISEELSTEWKVREPFVQMTSTGRVAIAFSADPAQNEDSLASRVYLAKGNLAGTRQTIRSPVRVNGDFEKKFATISGPSLALDAQGRAHLVYEWMSGSRTVIEYYRESGDGSFGDSIQIADAAFAPCPAIAVDEDGVHVTYLQSRRRHVKYVHVHDGTVEEPQALYPDEDYAAVDLALMTRDAETGMMHLVVREATDDGGERLQYVRTDGEQRTVVPVVKTPESNPGIGLTPRAGGLVRSGDELVVPMVQPADGEKAQNPTLATIYTDAISQNGAQ